MSYSCKEWGEGGEYNKEKKYCLIQTSANLVLKKMYNNQHNDMNHTSSSVEIDGCRVDAQYPPPL